MNHPLETRQGLRPVSSETFLPTWIESLEIRSLLSGSGQIQMQTADAMAIEQSSAASAAMAAGAIEVSFSHVKNDAAPIPFHLSHNTAAASTWQGFEQAVAGALRNIMSMNDMSFGGMSRIDSLPSRNSGVRLGYGMFSAPIFAPGFAWMISQFGEVSGEAFAPPTAPDMLDKPINPTPATNETINDPMSDATLTPLPVEQTQALEAIASAQPEPALAPPATLFGNQAISVEQQGEQDAVGQAFGDDNDAQLSFAPQIMPIITNADLTRHNRESVNEPSQTLASRYARENAQAEAVMRRHRVRMEDEDQALRFSRPGRVFASSSFDTAATGLTDEGFDQMINWKQMAALVGASVLIGSYAMEVQRRKRAEMAPWAGIEAEQ